MPERLGQDRIVGLKQVLKALEAGRLSRVYLARDAQAHLVAKVEQACRDAGAECVDVPSMKELGAACGIDVGAVCAGEPRN